MYNCNILVMALVLFCAIALNIAFNKTSHVKISENTYSLYKQSLVNERETKRYRRQTNFERDECRTINNCKGNQTNFDTTKWYYNCQCDNACYEIFQDCCADFVKTCGPQNAERKNSQLLWRCVQLHRSTLRGVWMVWSCTKAWNLNETKLKCENASERFSYPVEDFLPVLGEDGLTYRNKHCSICNGITHYQTWHIVVQGFITPPEEYDIDEKLKFVLANGGKIKNIQPGKSFPRRYCAGEKYKDSCKDSSHAAFNNCSNGPVETVVGLFTENYFKNKACALCNGETHISSSRGRRLIRLRVLSGELPQGLSIVFTTNSNKNGEPSVSRVVKNYCPAGLVYDDNLEYCREGLVTHADDTLSDVFLIALWFKPSSIKIPSFNPFIRFISKSGGSKPNINNITASLKSALVKKFSLQSKQVTAVKLHRQNIQSTFLVATFRFTLTPFQEYILANENNTLNISTKSQAFLELLKFTTNFSMNSGAYHFPVVKLSSKKLACFQGYMLQSREYVVDKISGNVIQNKTGKIFSRNEYEILGTVGENITICRKLLLSGCEKGAFVTLNESEYFIYENLTVFHYGTNKSFGFGEYHIIENVSSTRTDSFQNTSLPQNSTVAVCLPFGKTFNTTTEIVNTSETSYALRILTVIGFGISMLFLFVLLITYGIFKELRTLPGLNLMNLAISMMLSYLIWLIGTANFQETKTCEILGVIEHYLFLVTFVAMSVISYHSCVVFSRPFHAGVSSNSRKQFTKYSTITWLIPALFIAVCITLDQTEITFDIYGNTCWLSTDKAVLYLFLLPAAVLLLFNITTFIKTAMTLTQYNNDSQILQKDQKQNLLVCIKLATLVGFPWVFAFFRVIFSDVEAFEYLFVVFVSLQGLYIGLAFVCNKKTVQLYKKLWRSENRSSAESNPRVQTFQMS